MHAAHEKYGRLITSLQSVDSAILAFSGGVDSSFLLVALKDSGINYQAITAISPTMPAHDLDDVKSTIKDLNIDNHRIIESTEMDDENFTKNPNNRCFYCKSNLFKKLSEIALADGFNVVMDGSTADDVNDYRPGFQAKAQYNVKSPLLDANLNKDEIRFLSKEKGLKTWDKPASPCLSSRIPYGEKIVVESLRMVEDAENKLKSLGFAQVRVRKQKSTARIELREEDLPKILEDGNRDTVVSYCREIGFQYVTLDLEGYQSGKLNRVVKK